MKYLKLGYSIETQITKDYTVRANICRTDEHTYEFTLELCHTDIGQYHLINDDDIFRIDSDNVNHDVAAYILELFQKDYFTAFMDRYEYWVKCMTIGNEVLENYRGTAHG